MKKTLLFLTIFLLSLSHFGQISAKDSTFQVIGYWAMQDTQS
jgi:hypothetical protein